MKKLLIAAAITISFAGAVNTASASNGDVQFIGAVTSVTCNLQSDVDGSVSSMIQLGTVEAGKKGTSVEFSLKTVAGQAGCASLTGKTATITWAGNLTSNGLGNTGGKANDAWVELKGVNSKVVGTKITSSTASVEFDSDEITKNGAKFAATLTGGTVVGDFKSATAFVVAYN